MRYRCPLVLVFTLALPAALAANPSGVAAQASEEPPPDTLDLTRYAVIRGVVSRTGPDDPLPDAHVYVRGQPFSAVTDSLGRYTLIVPPGLWMLTLFHEEAAEMERPPTSLVTAEAGSGFRVDFALEPGLGSQARPFALEAMEVVVQGMAAEARARSGARYDVLDRRVLEERRETARHVGDLIQGQFVGVRVRQIDPSSLCIQAPRAGMIRSLDGPGACPGRVALVVDGVLIDDPGGWLAGINPHSVEGVEFLPAFHATTRWGRYAANGVLFIYTR